MGEKMRILVLGGYGLIGSVITRRLIADGPLEEVLADERVQAAYFGLVQP